MSKPFDQSAGPLRHARGAAELSECFMRQFVNDPSSLRCIAASESWQISSPVWEFLSVVFAKAQSREQLRGQDL